MRISRPQVVRQSLSKSGEPCAVNRADGVPAAEHILVIPANETGELDHWLAGRIYKPLFLYESQGLAVYRVYAEQ